jgi:hypothetical protein
MSASCACSGGGIADAGADPLHRPAGFRRHPGRDPRGLVATDGDGGHRPAVGHCRQEPRFQLALEARGDAGGGVGIGGLRRCGDTRDGGDGQRHGGQR